MSTFDENDDSPAVNPQGSGGGGSGSAEKSNDDINGGGGATDGILPSSSSAQLMTVVQQPLMRLTGHSEAVIAGEWIFGGEHLITASWDRTANVYDTETGKVINVLTGKSWRYFLFEHFCWCCRLYLHIFRPRPGVDTLQRTSVAKVGGDRFEGLYISPLGFSRANSVGCRFSRSQ